MSTTSQTTPELFDHYFASDGPAALVIREQLAPAEGGDAVFFPATYAAKKRGEDGGYNIDGGDRIKDPTAQNITLVDSVGSQANRIEPLFTEGEYAKLVPQIIIRAGERSVNLLEAGHRAGDAIARCSALQDDLQNAFKSVLNGDAAPLAKLAPTSLVFGVWDSRDTQAKLPRLLASVVRAYNVRKLTRSAQYTPATDYAALEVFSEEEKKNAEGDSANPLAARGFVHVPSTGTHGGVIADGGIRRDATLALSALRLLKSDTPENTLKLRRYILGLALVAFTRLPLGYYRQGTILVGTNKKELFEVALDGARSDASTKITAEIVLEYAKTAADAFVVGNDREVDFSNAAAVADVTSPTTTRRQTGGGRGRRAAATPATPNA